MTNRDKARLRAIMKNDADNYTDADAAEECNCTTATAAKYRRYFTPSGPLGVADANEAVGECGVP